MRKDEMIDTLCVDSNLDVKLIYNANVLKKSKILKGYCAQNLKLLSMGVLLYR